MEETPQNDQHQPVFPVHRTDPRRVCSARSPLILERVQVIIDGMGARTQQPRCRSAPTPRSISTWLSVTRIYIITTPSQEIAPMKRLIIAAALLRTPSRHHLPRRVRLYAPKPDFRTGHIA